MATGQVSSITGDTWQLIATNTPTSGTTTTFSSITGYKELWIIWTGVVGAANTLNMTFNSTSTGYSSFVVGWDRSTTAIYLSTDSSTSVHGFVKIKDVNSTTGPKMTEGMEYQNAARTTGVWNNTSAITTITITKNSAFTAGTFTLYGIAA